MSANDPFKHIISPPFLPPPIAPLRDSNVNPAKWMHERVVRSINDFEKDLDRDHEVGARLVTFGADVTFHIDDVGYWGPDIIIFYGVTSDGNRVQLLQHITQLSVLLIAVETERPEPRRIGFRLIERLEKEE